MGSKDLNKMIPKNFPQLQERYFEEIEWHGSEDTGSHNIYGGVFLPYLHECIEWNKATEMVHAFSFIENILELNDEYATDVMAVTILEWLAFHFSLRPDLLRYLGERSRVIVLETDVDLTR